MLSKLKAVSWGVIALCLSIASMPSCKKDTPLPLDANESSSFDNTLSIEKAKAVWQANAANSVGFRDESTEIVPLWTHAIETKFRGTEPIIIVPFQHDSLSNTDGRGRIVMVFYNHPESNLVSIRFLGYYSPGRTAESPQVFDIHNFTGYLFGLTRRGYPFNILEVRNGSIIRVEAGGYPSNDFGHDDNNVDFRCEVLDEPSENILCCNFFTDRCCSCPTIPGSDGGWGGLGNFFSWLGGTLNTIIGEGGTNPPSPILTANWPTFGALPTGDIGNGGGGIGNSNTGIRLSDYFSISIFNLQAPNPQLVGMVEEFRSTHCGSLSTNQLFGVINPACFEEPEAFDECASWSMLNWFQSHVVLSPPQIALLESDEDLVCEGLSLFFDLASAGYSLGEIDDIISVALADSETLILITNFLEEHGEGNPDLLDELVYFLVANSIYEFGDISDFIESYSSQEEDRYDTPLTSGGIWSIATPIKQDLLNRYPSDAAKINNFFICRVMAMAFEDVVLESLENFDDRNAPLPGSSGTGARPDGYHARSFRGAHSEWVANGLHVITEVKTKFTSPPTFDWSSNLSQFTQYRTFLATNQYEGQMPNTLYLVLPAGIEVNQSIIDACSSQNIQIIVSEVQISSVWGSDWVRVSNPVSKNEYELDYHPSLAIPWLARRFPTNHLKSPIGGQFSYRYVNFKAALESRAAQFEQSYLQDNTLVTCPDE